MKTNELSSGVYKIESKMNGELYIGGTSNLYSRKNGHFSSLKNNVHNNNNLQDHVNKYGIDDLNFIVIEYVKKDMLVKREQFYIDKLSPKFNISKTAGSCAANEGMIEKQIEVLNTIISKSVEYSQSFTKAKCYLTEDGSHIIIDKEFKNNNYIDFKTKIPVNDINKVIIRERSRLSVHNNYEPKDKIKEVVK